MSDVLTAMDKLSGSFARDAAGIHEAKRLLHRTLRSFGPSWTVLVAGAALLMTGMSHAHNVTLRNAGSFATGEGGTPLTVVVADMNRDGKPDVVTNGYPEDAASPSPGISVLLGNGNGTLQPVRYTGTGGYFEWLGVGELDRNGKRDVLIGDVVSGYLGVLLGKGDGTLGPRQWVAHFNREALLADFNRDAKVDVLMPGSKGNVSVLLGQYDGSFRPPRYSSNGTAVGSLASADFDRDGKPDVAIGSYEGGRVTVLLGKGDGGFLAERHSPVSAGGGIGAVSAGDINRDGIPDLAVLNNLALGDPYQSHVSILLGRGDGSFLPQPPLSLADDPEHLAVVDMDGDDKLDLVIVNRYYADHKITVLSGKGNGAFRPAQLLTVPLVFPRSMAVADMNRDAKPDLVIGQFYEGDVVVLLNTTP